MAPTRRLRKLINRLSASHERHRERHEPSGFAHVVADDLADLPAGAWERLTAGGSFFLSSSYLRALAATAPANVHPRYALLLRGKEPVAAIAAQRVDTEFADWIPVHVPTGNTSVLGRVRRRALGALPAGMLVCGNLLSWGQHGICAAPGEDAYGLWSGVVEALAAIVRADRERRRPDFIMIKDLVAPEAAGEEALHRRRWQCHETEPDMVLAIPRTWRTYADYLGSLNAKYRKAARKIVKDVEAAGIRMEHPTDLDSCAESMQTLYGQVLARSPHRPVQIRPEYLPAVARAAGDRFGCSVLRRDGQMLGFVTLLQDGDTAVGYLIGLDYAVNEQVPIYFRLLLSVIEQAIARGCRRLSFGRTALEPKARLGARPEPMRVWIRHRHSLVNLMIREVVRDIPHDQAPDRNPFKTEGGGEGE